MDKSEAQSVRILAVMGVLAVCGLGYSVWGLGGFVLGCLIGATVCVAQRVKKPRRR